MAKTYLGDWGTYYRNTNTASPSGSIDWQTRWKIEYEQNSSGISKVYVQPYLKIYANSPFGSGTSSVTIATTINGTTKNQTISSYTTVEAGYFYKYGTIQEFTIQHDSAGQAQCEFSGSMTGTSAGSYTRRAAHTWDLPTINVNSSISNSTSSSARSDFGSSVTFSIVRPNNSITHTLSYKIGNTNYTIGSGIASSKSYSFPTSLVNSFPSNENVNITVTCTSSNGTSSQTVVYLKIPETYIPTISLEISDVGTVPSDWGIYVKTKSKIKGVITASGAGGSTIKSYSSSANKQTFNTSEFLTSELSESGNQTIASKITDSRGRSKSVSKNISVVNYAPPSYIKIEVVRCNADGIEDNDGTFGKAICKYSISPCENKNAKSLKVSYGNTTKTFLLENYSGTIIANSSQLFSGLDVTANHTFSFKLIDSFNPSGIPQNFLMPPSYVLVSKKAGGKGITFGQIATDDGLHSFMESTFHKGLNVEGDIFVGEAKIIERGSINSWSYTKFSDGTMFCGRSFYGFVDITTNIWDTWFYGKVDFGDFPITFTATPVIVVSPQTRSGTQYFLAGTDGTNYGTATNAGAVTLFRPNSRTEVNYRLNVFAFGRWKQVIK